VRSRVSDDNRTGYLIWAAALAVGGLVLLLFNLGVFAVYEPFLQYGLALLLGLGSLGFFGSYLFDRSHWWRLIPAWTLLALAGMLYLSTIEALDQRWTATLLFVGQAIAFAHIYLLNRLERWWAIIPGGFMLVLGTVIALSSRTTDPELLGAVLFTGMGSVFLLLYLLDRGRRPWWALIPGAVLVVFGLLVIPIEDRSQQAWWRWWPLILILLGALAAWRAFQPPKSEKLPMQSASNLSRHATAKPVERGKLGEYRGPAPGASVEVISEPDDD
jgi:hypothetical protein